jgi:predicted esterase
MPTGRSLQPRRAREFWADTFRLLDLSAAKKDDDALNLAIAIVERFPEQAAEASYLLSCAYNRAGRPEDALRTLEASLDRGNCWHDSLLVWSPSLKSLRDLPRFHEILAKSTAMMDALEADTRVGVRVFRPKGSPTTPPPLFLPLHGGADVPGEHDGYWAAATGLGVLVAVAQSSQRRSSDAFWWGGPGDEPFDRERSERDVGAAYDEVRATSPFDVGRVALGGFSQGAVLAVTLALKNQPFPVRGFACVGPGIQDMEPLLPLIEPAAARGLRAWILAGENERGLELITRLGHELGSRGVPCKLDVVPRLGHEFPEDFGTRIQSGLSFVLAG